MSVALLLSLAYADTYLRRAYGHYLSIDPHKPETREMAAEFKGTYCWPGVRIHFVGVWYYQSFHSFPRWYLRLTFIRDTVSSLGLIKGDTFVSTSASVINASHFRHALALDERRVKFMPEYFQEMNTQHNNILRVGAKSDVKEVWFAGCHADVYVTYRPTQTTNLMCPDIQRRS